MSGHAENDFQGSPVEHDRCGLLSDPLNMETQK